MIEIKDDLSSEFTTVASYQNEPSFSLTQADGLEEGRIYTIRWFATNSKGEGVRSDELVVALVDTPLAP